MLTYEALSKTEKVREYIRAADEALSALGYTEHSFPHVTKVATDAAYILKTLGYPERDTELAMIAGYLHDIGNLVNRHEHSISGAVMAYRILDEMNVSAREQGLIVSAIGNHDEGTGVAVNHIAAALIIADKCDVRRSRVRNTDRATFDIHDRVNYSVTDAKIEVADGKITLTLKIDSEISSVMDYFEIFLGRMVMCKNAAAKLGLEFKLNINGQNLL